MATPSTSGTQKRSIQMVDPDDTTKEIQTSKKIRAEPNQDRKTKCLKFIVSAYKKISDKIKGMNAVNDDIMVGCQITNVLFSAYTINRQRAAGLVGNTEQQANAKKEYTFSKAGTHVSVKTDIIVKLVAETATEVGHKFAAPTSTDSEWYGTVAPYLNFFLAFQLRMNELRTGHGNMPIKKEGGTSKAFPVSKYGFNGSHHIPIRKKKCHGSKPGSSHYSLMLPQIRVKV